MNARPRNCSPSRSYDVKLELKVAAVGGSFDGKVSLEDQNAPESCRLVVSGGGTLGSGEGAATVAIVDLGGRASRLDYSGEGEVGGLVAGVGQRVAGSVARMLAKQFFTALRREFPDA